MSASLGRLCLILHGHLPYVLHHGNWPHGEVWLHEAAAETYLPLLELLDEFAKNQLHCGVTLGLTPVLLEQLATKHFKAGFVTYLHHRIALAQQDARDFTVAGQGELAALATRWELWFDQKLKQFQAINQNIPEAFAQHYQAGRIEILASLATHAYTPLLLKDESIRAQLSVGLATSERLLGIRPRGFWLPECAYRPTVENWKPAVLFDDTRSRVGLENILHAEGLTHFFVDTHLVAHAKPLAMLREEGMESTNDALVFWDIKRAWGNPLDPVGVASEPEMPEVFAFARHPLVAEQVWSKVTGYPGAGEYLEFHRKHNPQGLRYHRVTHHDATIARKALYEPDKVPGKVYEHAQHFCTIVRSVLMEYTAQTGRVGTVVAPFDAELFGHWWFEGPRFLRDVLMTLAHDGSVTLATSQQALETAAIDKVVRMPEGSWGEGGHHHVWLNDQTRWLWEMEYRAEERFHQLVGDLDWQTNSELEKLLKMCARELLLLQGSDWPFVIHSKGAVDYGISRFAGHATRFDRLANIAVSVSRGETINAIQQTEIAEAEAHDTVFAEIDLNWWE